MKCFKARRRIIILYVIIVFCQVLIVNIVVLLSGILSKEGENFVSIRYVLFMIVVYTMHCDLLYPLYDYFGALIY